MESYTLSKSTYIRGLQCLKSLYLNKHRPYLRDKLSEEQLAKFARGHAVGKVAWQLFPDGKEMPRPGIAAAEKTALLVKEGFPVIYEACFIHNGVIVALDILVKQPDGWNAYEVKSSGTLSDVFFQDAYLQYYLIRGAGLPVNRFFLVHRNPEVAMDSYENVIDFFLFKELNEPDAMREEETGRKIMEMKEVLQRTKSPDISPGNQCMLPYPCDFRGVCWKHLSEETRNSLLNLNSTVATNADD